jgi:multiple sugar transport system substrate-binding protein
MRTYPGLATENFADGVAGAATAVAGQIVSVPWVSDTRVLFYRKDILEAAGFSAPPATWDELRSMAKKLSERGEGQYGYYIPQWDSPLPVVMTWSNGGDIVNADGNVDFSSPAFAAAVDLYTGLHADGSVPQNGDFDQTQGFISGIAPMLVSGPYLANAIAGAAPELDGKWSIATLPRGSASGTSLFAGSNMGVWFNTDAQDESLKLLEFLSKPDTQIAWFKLNGELPTVKSALADPVMAEDPLVKVYAAQLADAKVLPMVPNWDGGVGGELLKALNSIVLTGADRAEALANLSAATADASIN